MYNKKGEVKMDKTILVVEVIKYKNIPTAYHIKKTADNLEKASEYLVALKNLMRKNIAYYTDGAIFESRLALYKYFQNKETVDEARS